MSSSLPDPVGSRTRGTSRNPKKDEPPKKNRPNIFRALNDLVVGILQGLGTATNSVGGLAKAYLEKHTEAINLETAGKKHIRKKIEEPDSPTEIEERHVHIHLHQIYEQGEQDKDEGREAVPTLEESKAQFGYLVEKLRLLRGELDIDPNPTGNEGGWGDDEGGPRDDPETTAP